MVWVANGGSARRRDAAILLGVLLVLALAMMGCREECPIGETKCVGNDLWTCPSDPDGPYHWARKNCGALVCVTGEDPGYVGREESLCALEAEPRHACSGVVETCDGAEMLFCKNGFVVGAQTCASEAHCLTGLGSLSVCPLAPSPDPRCQSAESGWSGSYACDGTLSVECHVVADSHSDYAVSELDCGAAGCAHGVCGIDGPADPRCQAAAVAHPEWPVQVTCDGNAALVCSGNHLLYQRTCGIMLCFPGGPPNEPGSGGCNYGASVVNWVQPRPSHDVRVYRPAQAG